MARARVKVRGLVQGVSFRASTVDEARGLGLVGWVRNEPDGGVLLEAQGQRGDVEALVEWCREGPPGARVTDAQVEWIPDTQPEPSFRIRF